MSTCPPHNSLLVLTLLICFSYLKAADETVDGKLTVTGDAEVQGEVAISQNLDVMGDLIVDGDILNFGYYFDFGGTDFHPHLDSDPGMIFHYLDAEIPTMKFEIQRYGGEWTWGHQTSGDTAITQMKLDSNGRLLLFGLSDAVNAITFDPNSAESPISVGGQSLDSRYLSSGLGIQEGADGAIEFSQGVRFGDDVSVEGELSFEGGTSVGQLDGEKVEALNRLSDLAGLTKEGELLEIENGQVTGVAVTTNGEIYIAGRVLSDSAFSIGGEVISAVGRGLFVAKLSSVGDVLWINRFGGQSDRVEAIDLGSDGNITLAGVFGGEISPSEGVVLSKDQGGIYVIRYNASGDVVWATNFGSAGVDRVSARGLAVADDGSCFLVGQIEASIDLGVPSAVSVSNWGGYLTKVSSLGEVEWVKALEATSSLGLSAIALSDEKVCVGGRYNGVLDGGVPATMVVTSQGYADLFIAEYGINGDVLSVKSTGSTNASVRPTCLAYDSAGDIWVGGRSYGNSFLSEAMNHRDHSFIAKFGEANDRHELLVTIENGGQNSDGNGVGVSRMEGSNSGGIIWSGAFEWRNIVVNGVEIEGQGPIFVELNQQGELVNVRGDILPVGGIYDSSLSNGFFASVGFPSPEDYGGKNFLYIGGAFEKQEQNGFSWGGATVVNGAAAFGANASALAPGALAFGSEGKAHGVNSFAGGESAALGEHSFAFGPSARSSGDLSFSFGKDSDSTGYLGFAFGELVAAEGDYSVAIGYSSISNGDHAISLGKDVVVDQAESQGIGVGLNTKTFGEMALGRYHLPASNSDSSWNELTPALTVGNGEDASNRSNAIKVLKNGQTSLENKFWVAMADADRDGQIDDAADATANPDDPNPSSAEDESSGGEALVVHGHTRLRGKVVIEQAQGDVSMGIFGGAPAGE